MILGHKKQSQVDSMFSRVGFFDPLSCWAWLGHINKVSGYPQRGHSYAHRDLYEWMFGLIPKGMQLDHLCSNRACVNPWHLEPVTPHENVLRAFANKLCPKGHVRVPSTKTFPTRNQCRVCAYARAQAKRRLS